MTDSVSERETLRQARCVPGCGKVETNHDEHESAAYWGNCDLCLSLLLRWAGQRERVAALEEAEEVCERFQIAYKNDWRVATVAERIRKLATTPPGQPAVSSPNVAEGARTSLKDGLT